MLAGDLLQIILARVDLPTCRGLSRATEDYSLIVYRQLVINDGVFIPCITEV